ncbi:DNA/RNA helicase domain-containing protein [Kutzneria sp. NPDC052558]|uniref:DNA/RNA helicase domain-containing protein n=1 Tax=Kutzneria sp. NPDC052558 TaxID=3364121 RepID=UPI0037C78328
MVSGSVAELRQRMDDGTLVGELVRATGSRQPVNAETGEVGAWRKSLPILLDLMRRADMANVQVVLEHRLPYSPKRVDAVLCGVHPGTDEPSYMLVELKQWSGPIVAEAGGFRVNGLDSLQLHPSEQVFRYGRQLLDFHPDLARAPHRIRGIAYLHNAEDRECAALNRPKFTAQDYLATKTRVSVLEGMLRRALDATADHATNRRVAKELIDARAAPAKTLLTTAAGMFENRGDFVLLDEQKLAYDMVMDAVGATRRGDNRKRVVIVLGGPGSGKSAIAMSLLAKLARTDAKAVHATGSRAFTQTLWKRVARGDSRVKSLFVYFRDFRGHRKNELDVVICDEAHRIRDTRATSGDQRLQIEELIDVAKVPVFLLDERQVVRPNEVGTQEYIESAATARGCDVEVVRLEGQFRCGGSVLYDEWVRRLLGLSDEPPVVWSDLVAGTGDEYVVRTEESPASLEQWLLDRTRETEYTARIAAGFCWPWSDPVSNGRGGRRLVDDVAIGDWRRPWNTPDGKQVDDAPPSALWASDPKGFNQVGCIYTAQGFEYDWAGVIFGEDLVVRDGRWVAQLGKSRDSVVKKDEARFDELVRNTYKVLLTRGMHGVCLHSIDDETNEFLRKYSR